MLKLGVNVVNGVIMYEVVVYDLGYDYVLVDVVFEKELVFI